MLKNYLKIAFRNFWRNKSFSAINIFGLAIGLATCLVIALYVTDELSYDKYNEKAGRIYRVNADFRINGEALNERLGPAALGPALVKEYPQIEKTVRIAGDGDGPGEEDILVRKGDETVTEHNACYADSTLFDVFTLPMLAGNPKTALTQPGEMVVSESVAKKYFTTTNFTDVVGKTLLVNNKDNYKITGVIKDMPEQSHIHFNFIRAFAGKTGISNNNWLDNGYVTYLLARPGITAQTINGYLETVTQKYAEPQLKAAMNTSFDDMAKRGDYYRYTVIPLTDIHLYSQLAREAEPSGNIQYVRIFTVVAIFILLIACVNFMNLSTARSAGRSKEVGVRKILGSRRSGLIGQFLTESVATSVMALILALVIVALVLPYFNQLAGKQITLGLFSSKWLLPFLLSASIIVGLMAGSYPAFFLSAFKPIQVLKGKISTGLKGTWLRNSLVVFQFATAIILIVGTLVIYNQLSYIRDKKLGYNKQQVLVLQNTALLGSHVAAFKDEALKIAGVKAATITDVLPTSNQSNTELYFKDAYKSDGKSMGLEAWYTDADYISTMGMEIIKGRKFSPLMPSDSTAVVINETTARVLGYSDPINKSIYEQGEDGMVKHSIIGVVKDFNTGSLRNKIPPVVFSLNGGGQFIAMRIDAKNATAVIAQLKNKYHEMDKMAGLPFTYSFMDEEFNALYKSDERMGAIFIYFAVFAVLIACLGLFGLVTYAAEQRTKEIGIRKVLGATVSNIVNMLNKDFLLLVAIAASIAFPLAWWGMNKWLQGFAYRTNISWWVFAAAGMSALLLTLITVSFRAIKAAMANPVKSLKAE